MTMTRSVASSTTPRSWLIRMAVKPRSRCRSLIVSITACCTITSSAVVGSSNTIIRGCRDSTSAIETRCRIPPDSSCGNRVSTAGSRRTASSSSAPRRRMPSARQVVARPGVRLEDVAEVVLDGPHRVQRVHAALQDQREAVAPRPAQLLAAPGWRRRCRRRRSRRSTGGPAGAASGSGRSRASTCRTRTRPTSPTNSPCSRVRSTSRTDQILRAAGRLVDDVDAVCFQ